MRQRYGVLGTTGLIVGLMFAAWDFLVVFWMSVLLEESFQLLGAEASLTVDQVASGNATPLEGTYNPFALAEKADEDPLSTGLLTMLLLASFLGTSVVGWLLPNAQGQGALCFSSLGVGEVLGCAREDYLPFLEVFRL